MNIIPFNRTESPFDSIRHIDEQGNEFWLARELMPVLGYSKWERFNGVIEVAMENLETVTNSVSQHASLYWEASGKTQRLNYQLTRLACYHIALSCDSRGNESVKMAKHYFAVKTREAEVKIPQQNDEIEALKLKLALAHAEKERAIAEKNLLDTRQFIITSCPEPVQQKILGYEVVKEKVIEKVVYKENEFIRNDSTINKTKLCKRYGILTKNGKPDYTRLNKILVTAQLPEDAWYGVKDIQTNKELKKEYLSILDNLIVDDSRQLWLGE
jgi:hypothetical protein